MGVHDASEGKSEEKSEEKVNLDAESTFSEAFGNAKVASATEMLGCFSLFKKKDAATVAQKELETLITQVKDRNGNKKVDLAIVYDALYALFYGIKLLKVEEDSIRNRHNIDQVMLTVQLPKMMKLMKSQKSLNPGEYNKTMQEYCDI